MAANNLVSYDLKGVKESFANWISNLSPSDTPFTSMTGKESIKNKYFQWQEDRLGSVAINAVTEGSDAGDASQTATEVRQNVTQILRKVTSVSDTANALSSYGRGSELQYQLEKASKELKRDIEWALLNNGAAVDVAAPGTSNLNASVAGSGTPAYDLGTDINGVQLTGAVPQAGARRTAGFQALVAPLNVASPEDPLAVVHQKTATAGVVTEAEIFSVTQGLYLAGACADTIMFHPRYAKFFSSLMERVPAAGANRMRMFDGAVDTKVNTYVSTLIDPLGCTYRLIPNRFMPIDKIFIFMASDWTQMILRQPVTQQLAKLGSFDKYMVEVELGLRHRNQFASGILEVGYAVNNDPAPTVSEPVATQPGGTNKMATLNITGGTGLFGNTSQIATTGVGAGKTVTYVSENPSIATVTSTGLITAVAPGSTRIVVSTGGAASYVRVVVAADAAVKTLTFAQNGGIKDANLTTASVGLLDGSVVANGTPAPTVTYEWRKTTPGGTNFTVINGETTAKLDVTKFNTVAGVVKVKVTASATDYANAVSTATYTIA